MNGSIRRPQGALLVLAAIMLLASAGQASAQTVPSDLRVVVSDGQELSDVRQYVGRTIVPTSPDADCFGPGNGGSGAKVTQVGPDALSVVVEASGAKDRLRPLLITDAFLDDGFGLGVCAIGGYEAPPSGFWYLKVNHKNPNLGGSLVTVGPGTETLWYLTPSFPPGNELVLSAPVRATPGVPVRVEVIAYADDGTPSPATGAIVEGASAPATVDASGGADVTFAQPGEGVLRASRAGDIPSQFLRICVADPESRCPSVRGREVVGTDGADNVVGTLGNDLVKPRAGNDNVKSRGGADRIISRGGGADKVKCGGGKDLVEADKKDRIGKSCERAKGARNAPGSGKTKGGKKR
jgi:hypothetical protein